MSIHKRIEENRTEEDELTHKLSKYLEAKGIRHKLMSPDSNKNECHKVLIEADKLHALLLQIQDEQKEEIAEKLKDAFADRLYASDIPEGQHRRFYDSINEIIKKLTGESINEKLGFYPPKSDNPKEKV